MLWKFISFTHFFLATIHDVMWCDVFWCDVFWCDVMCCHDVAYGVVLMGCDVLLCEWWGVVMMRCALICHMRVFFFWVEQFSNNKTNNYCRSCPSCMSHHVIIITQIISLISHHSIFYISYLRSFITHHDLIITINISEHSNNIFLHSIFEWKFSSHWRKLIYQNVHFY